MVEYFASVDVGGTTTRVAFGTARGDIESVQDFPTHSHEGPAALLERIASAAEHLADDLGSKPKRLGIGLPGLVDTESGLTKFLPNMPTHWVDVPVGKTLSDRVGCEVILLNDVRQHTMGELAYGHGKGRERLTLVYMGIGTGIGGGIVIDGKLRLGQFGAAGEIGHVTILPSGPRCGCGNRGCLETLASGPAIAAAGIRLLDTGQADELHKIVDGNADRVSAKTMTEAAKRGDVAIREVIEQSAEYLGFGLSAVITTISPDMIVIGGGVSLIGDMLFDKVRETITQRVKMFPTDQIQLFPSQLGDDAGVLGGLASAAFGTEA